MLQKTDAVVASTIGIDTGKNTLHLIGLDDQGTIVLREKLSRSRIVSRLANSPVEITRTGSLRTIACHNTVGDPIHGAPSGREMSAC